jgi:phytanoyl-CoA hydroxylase
MLSTAQRALFEAQGYLTLPGFRSAAAVASVVERTRQLLDTTALSDVQGVFAARDAALDDGRGSDDWFLGSDTRVRCFFEEEALDADGRLNRPLPQAINKIGHALHDIDPVFEAFSHGPDLAELAADLGMAQPQVWQSMVICKQPGIGGAVRWHQDASYLYCEQGAVTGFWFALEDADTDNGCLWMLPGGHRAPQGVLRERFFRDGNRTWLQPLDSTPWPSWDEAVPLPCTAGTLVVFHGLMPHASQANRSPRSRLAYTLHASDASAGYAASNWIRRDGTLPVRGFLLP